MCCRKRTYNKILFKSNPVTTKLSKNSFSYLDKYLKENIGREKLIRDLKIYISRQKDNLKESDIIGICWYGGLTTVFELTNNRVIKCSLESPLEYRQHHSEFDIPFLSPVKKFGEHYFVIEPKAELENEKI